MDMVWTQSRYGHPKNWGKKKKTQLLPLTSHLLFDLYPNYSEQTDLHKLKLIDAARHCSRFISASSSSDRRRSIPSYWLYAQDWPLDFSLSDCYNCGCFYFLFIYLFFWSSYFPGNKKKRGFSFLALAVLAVVCGCSFME